MSIGGADGIMGKKLRPEARIRTAMAEDEKCTELRGNCRAKDRRWCDDYEGGAALQRRVDDGGGLIKEGWEWKEGKEERRP